MFMAATAVVALYETTLLTVFVGIGRSSGVSMTSTVMYGLYGRFGSSVPVSGSGLGGSAGFDSRRSTSVGASLLASNVVADSS